MAMILGLLGKGFGRLGAARAKDKAAGGVVFSPSLDFSDARNSQYAPFA